MIQSRDILCIGSVLWDVIGRTASHMTVGSDVPGRITRLPGGVALNIAMTLKRFGLSPILLSAVGRDAEGEELLNACTRMGINTEQIYRSEDLPTDRYMAIEGADGLVAAIADAHSLEAANERILAPLMDGRFGSPKAPYQGLIALDGNLTEPLLRDIASSAAFERADLRVAPASPGKALRLLMLLDHPNATFYVNLEEAGLLSQRAFDSSADAARHLLSLGMRRVLVTDGANPASDGRAGRGTGREIITKETPQVLVTRGTGAGDTFMAAHIAAECQGAAPEDALERALNAAASYVAGDTHL